MNKSMVGIIVAGMALTAVSDVQTWNAENHDDTKWNTTSENWDAGSVWVNGNSAVFPSGGAPTHVSEVIRLSGLTTQQSGERNVYSENSGKLVFEGDAPTIGSSGDGIMNLPLPVESDSQLSIVSGTVGLYGANVLPNGCRISGNNTALRINSEASLGVGDVVMESGSALWTTVSGLDITNRIVQNGLAYGGALAEGSPTFRRIGTTSANSSHAFGFGRINGGASSVVLSLADDSEGIGHFAIRGNFNLTVNGGTIKARPDSSSPFFRDWSGESHWNHEITVGREGFVFDSNGSPTELDLGATLKFAQTSETVTNNGEVCSTAYANPSLESGLTGWTLGRLEGAKYDSSRQNNTGAFCNDEAYYTKDGSWFIALRCYNYAETTISVPEAGLWRLACDIGHRPGGYTGYTIPVTVTVDMGTDNEQTYVIPSRGKAHPFTYCETCPFELEAGEHTVRYATGNVETGNDMSTVHLDAFRIVKADVETHELSQFVKKGTGTLTVTSIETDGRIAVSNGTLRLVSPAVVGAKVDVATGATLELCAGSVADARMTVPAGATVRFSCDIMNYINNGRFETPVTSGYAVGMGGSTGWLQISNNDNSISGIQRNGSAMSSGSAATPEGDQTAYVRARGGVIYQTFTVVSAGTYRLSFLQAQRWNYKDNLTTVVAIDENDVLTLPPEASAQNEFRRYATDVSLSAGEHTVKFTVTGGNANSEMFIDDVRLVDMSVPPTSIAGGRIDLASGSTVDLQNMGCLEIPKGVLFVDGVEITGRNNALQSAGVNVIGSGSIYVPNPGFAIFVR